MFDPFKQAKLQNGYSKLKNTTLPEKDISLDDLKRLSGSGQVTGDNIKPGDQAWFRLMFAKTHLTGEDPFSKN